MDGINPDRKNRSYLLPPGCKDLIDLLPKWPSNIRVNGAIQSRQVRVIGKQGQQFGIMQLVDAIRLANSSGTDLIELVRSAKPPICRLMDYREFRYKLSKKSNKQM